MAIRDPRIDAYIARSAEFARPILSHLRKVVHAGCPGVEETIKWGMPHFVHQGGILCEMAAFKRHVAFGFWKWKPTMARAHDRSAEAMGNLGRIAALSELPPERVLIGYVRQAVVLKDTGAPPRVKRRARPARPVRIPAGLAAALRTNAPARKTFDTLSPSRRREYVEWLTEAKREETRARRMAQALEWLAQGKTRNWKYERRG